MAPLTAEEKALLDFAAKWWRFPGARAEGIRAEFSLSETAYWRKVNGLVDRQSALAYAPVTVGRLLRLRTDRLRARSARGLALALGG